MNLERYKRHLSLPEIGQNGQKKIHQASVLCIGAGGLGCPLLIYLTAAGIGRIGIIDPDIVEEINLHRQILFDETQIGKNKSLAAVQSIKNLNADTRLESFEEKFHENNAENLISDYDLIIDATDNFKATLLINETCLRQEKPWVYASVQGFDGQITSFYGTEKEACFSCLYPDLLENTAAPNCNEAGILGPVAGIMGLHQALEAIKIIVGHDALPPLYNKLYKIDFKTMRTTLLQYQKNPQCPACSADNPPKQEFLPEIEQWQISDLKEKLSDKTLFILDVREPEEWNMGHIEGAKLHSLSQIMIEKLPNINKSSEILLYCQKGMRSQHAAEILRDNGFQNLKNLIGGYSAWKNSNSNN